MAFFFWTPLCADWLLVLRQTESKLKGLVSASHFGIVPKAQKDKVEGPSTFQLGKLYAYVHLPETLPLSRRTFNAPLYASARTSRMRMR